MNVRCMLIDLSAFYVEYRTLSGIGWEIHLETLKDAWDHNPDMVSLSTGALTGTGAPGSGGFNWCCWKNNKFQVIPAEGRLGAACRYERIDHLLIKGVAECPLDIVLRDGGFTFLPTTDKHPGAAKLYRNIRRQLDGDFVIMTVGAKEALEDGTFRIGDESLARKLRHKNLRSIAVMATGSIPINSPESFLAVCQEIYQARREKRDNPEQKARHGEQNELASSSLRGASFCDAAIQKSLPLFRNNPAQKAIARYLSLSGAADDGRTFPSLAMDSDEVQPAVESLLGLYWGNDFPLDNPLLYASRLMSAYAGKPLTTSSIEKIALESINIARTIRCGK